MPVIARPVQADEDTVRDVIHRLHEVGLACLDPQWAEGRSCLLRAGRQPPAQCHRPHLLGRPEVFHALARKASRSVRSWATFGAQELAQPYMGQQVQGQAAVHPQCARICSEKGIRGAARPWRNETFTCPAIVSGHGTGRLAFPRASSVLSGADYVGSVMAADS